MTNPNRRYRFWKSYCWFLLLLALLAVTATANDGGDNNNNIQEEGGNGVEEEDDHDDEEKRVLVAQVSMEFPSGRERPPPRVHIENKNAKCEEWAASGECEANPDYMMENCAKACGTGDENKPEEEGSDDDDDEEEPAPPKMVSRVAMVYRGEDASVGAFRFAEEFADVYKDLTADQVLDVARRLEEVSEERSYRHPEELTHCESGGKVRPCSAGKLWKRSEEMKGAGMYDTAGADLIRALLKKGLETDFVQKCHGSLERSLQGIHTQRERERRQKEEELKQQLRLEEEQQAMEEAKVSS